MMTLLLVPSSAMFWEVGRLIFKNWSSKGSRYPKSTGDLPSGRNYMQPTTVALPRNIHIFREEFLRDVALCQRMTSEFGQPRVLNESKLYIYIRTYFLSYSAGDKTAFSLKNMEGLKRKSNPFVVKKGDRCIGSFFLVWCLNKNKNSRRRKQ